MNSQSLANGNVSLINEKLVAGGYQRRSKDGNYPSIVHS